MKKYIVIFLGVVIVCFSCKKETIGLYDSTNYVSFGKELKDTSSMSFFFYMDDVVIYPLQVKLIGKMLTKDTEFSIVADEKKTTLDKSLYELPEKFVFRAGLVVDTAYITLKNGADLLINQYLLQLSIKSGRELLSVNSTFASNVILVSDRAERPVWWTSSEDASGEWIPNSVESNYLGAYSRLKYETYMRATGYTDLGKTHAEMRRRSVLFLHWLKKQDPQLIDEDGRIMEIPVIG